MEGKSLGEKRIRCVIEDVTLIDHSNISKALQELAARSINCCDTIKVKQSSNTELTDEQKAEAARLASIAQTHFETAAMFAKKAATVGLPDMRNTTKE